MSDSAHQGDAARLEAALERIVHALGRAAQTPALPPDTTPPLRQAAAPDAGAEPGPASHAPGAAATVDVAQIGARLDGLIAELRGVLGEDGEPPGDAPAHS